MWNHLIFLPSHGSSVIDGHPLGSQFLPPLKSHIEAGWEGSRLRYPCIHTWVGLSLDSCASLQQILVLVLQLGCIYPTGSAEKALRFVFQMYSL